MKIEPVWKVLAGLMAIGLIVLSLVNLNWGARNLFAEFFWEISAQLIHAAAIFVPFVIAVLVGTKIKDSIAALVVGVVVFFACAFGALMLIDELPGQIQWRIDAMTGSDYDGSRR